MKAGGGNPKGKAFERLIANMVVAKFGALGITKKDCYRTPMSGGHIHAKETDPGDLVISPRFRKLFPYHVECKWYRKINVMEFLVPVRLWKKTWKARVWMKQIDDARIGDLVPLLVFKENNGHIMVATPATQTNRFPRRICFVYQGREWMIVRFKTFLHVLGKCNGYW